MKDDNFLREMNGRYLWQPMAHPGEARANPPRIIKSAEGVRLTDIDGHATVDAVAGLWCVNLGYSNEAVKQAITESVVAVALLLGLWRHHQSGRHRGRPCGARVLCRGRDGAGIPYLGRV